MVSISVQYSHMTRQDCIKLAGEIGCDPRTVERWVAAKDNVNGATAYALEIAAKKLGIEPPDRTSEAETTEATG